MSVSPRKTSRDGGGRVKEVKKMTCMRGDVNAGPNRCQTGNLSPCAVIFINSWPANERLVYSLISVINKCRAWAAAGPETAAIKTPEIFYRGVTGWAIKTLKLFYNVANSLRAGFCYISSRFFHIFSGNIFHLKNVEFNITTSDTAVFVQRTH